MTQNINTPPDTPNPPNLLDQVREKLRLRHYSKRTERSYVGCILRYIRHFGKRHPRDMGAAEVTSFLTHLVVAGNVAAATQNQALSALSFLYREVPGGGDLPWLNEVVRAKTPQRLPVAHCNLSNVCSATSG